MKINTVGCGEPAQAEGMGTRGKGDVEGGKGKAAKSALSHCRARPQNNLSHPLTALW